MQFDQFALDSRLLEAVASVGYTEPTPIQEKAIPPVLAGHDVLGLAQTGTGKTAAFALPVLHRLLPGRTGRIRALVVAPTRELAEQIRQSFADLGRYTKLRTVAVYGGVSKVPQIHALRRADIVVACPGRLLDHLDSGDIDLSQVETLILDEADHMFDMGFLPDIRRILRAVPRNRQSLLFSATMPNEIRGLAESTLRNPVEVKIGRSEPADTIDQAVYRVRTTADKMPLLFSVLEEAASDRVLVFTRTKHRAKGVARKLKAAGYEASDLQGNLSQSQRERAIGGFRNGRISILVATDIAARGIDVSEVSHVINFDMTDTVDAYTHRVGRTGRARRTGTAWTFVEPKDEAMLRDVERALGERIDVRFASKAPPRTAERTGVPAPASGGRAPNGADRPLRTRASRLGGEDQSSRRKGSSGADRGRGSDGAGAARKAASNRRSGSGSPSGGRSRRPDAMPPRSGRPSVDRSPRVTLASRGPDARRVLDLVAIPEEGTTQLSEFGRRPRRRAGRIR